MTNRREVDKLFETGTVWFPEGRNAERKKTEKYDALRKNKVGIFFA